MHELPSLMLLAAQHSKARYLLREVCPPISLSIPPSVTFSGQSKAEHSGAMLRHLLFPKLSSSRINYSSTKEVQGKRVWAPEAYFYRWSHSWVTPKRFKISKYALYLQGFYSVSRKKRPKFLVISSTKRRRFWWNWVHGFLNKFAT